MKRKPEKPDPAELFVCTAAFAADLDGVPYVVRLGERLPADHILVEKYGDAYFQSSDVDDWTQRHVQRQRDARMSGG